MSTLQNTARHHHRIRTGALALGALIAVGLALLIITPTGHGTRAPTTASIAQPLSPAALTASTPAPAACVRDPGTHALACSHAAPYPIATDASMGYFRDPVTHKPMGAPARRKRGQHRPPHPSSGGVAP